MDSLDPLGHKFLIGGSLEFQRRLRASIELFAHIESKVIYCIAQLKRQCGIQRDVFTMIEPRVLYWTLIGP